MIKMTDQSIINVVEAHKQGFQIEQCAMGEVQFHPKNGDWNFSIYSYRIKPEVRKIKLLGWWSGLSIHLREAKYKPPQEWKRVPSEDREIEVVEK